MSEPSDETISSNSSDSQSELQTFASELATTPTASDAAGAFLPEDDRFSGAAEGDRFGGAGPADPSAITASLGGDRSGVAEVPDVSGLAEPGESVDVVPAGSLAGNAATPTWAGEPDADGSAVDGSAVGGAEVAGVGTADSEADGRGADGFGADDVRVDGREGDGPEADGSQTGASRAADAGGVEGGGDHGVDSSSGGSRVADASADPYDNLSTSGHGFESVADPPVAAAAGEGPVQAELDELADPERLRSALEAVLLVVDTPTSSLMLAQVLGRSVPEVEGALRSLRDEFDAGGRGMDLREVADGWRLYSRDEFAGYVERFILDGQQARLTQASLETLAVIAYRQPVTRSRISGIRGVSVDAVMRTLLTRGLVEECGADPDTGGGLYRTTRLFLEKMGLRSLDELPSLAPLLPDTSQLDDVELSS